AFDNVTSLGDNPIGLAISSSGILWISQQGASFISEYNPANDSYRSISTSIPSIGYSAPYLVSVDQSSGDVWFTEQYGNSIGEFNPATNVLVEYEIPTKLSSFGNISGGLTMALSSSGTPWFSELYSGKLGEINTSAPVQLSIS